VIFSPAPLVSFSDAASTLAGQHQERCLDHELDAAHGRRAINIRQSCISALPCIPQMSTQLTCIHKVQRLEAMAEAAVIEHCVSGLGLDTQMLSALCCQNLECSPYCLPAVRTVHCCLLSILEGPALWRPGCSPAQTSSYILSDVRAEIHLLLTPDASEEDITSMLRGRGVLSHFSFRCVSPFASCMAFGQHSSPR